MSSKIVIPSPTATGGSGTFFEQHVDAFFLALMLVRGIPPILKNCHVEEVHLQTRHRGWSTDDLLIVGSRESGRRRHLAVQVKLKLTISVANEDCRSTFTGFWNDFKHNSEFDPDNDCLALVTLRGTNSLLDSFNNLLYCAQASADGADFANRLNAYPSKNTQNQAAAIRTIIQTAEGCELENNDFWRFLKVLHVVSFDLNTPSAQNEVWVKALLERSTHELDPVAAAETTWRELLELVGSGMPKAASYTYTNLPISLRIRHENATQRGGLGSLVAHGRTILNGIHTTIAHTATIRRDELVAGVLEGIDQHQVVLLTGPAGFGKSALARTVVDLLNDNLFCLAFRAEEFAISHIDLTLQQAQASINTEQLRALLAAQDRTLILVESVERLLEASVRDAFSDLLQLAAQDRSIRLLLTCRDYSVDTVRASLLERAGLSHSVIKVPALTDDELAQVMRSLSSLSGALESVKLRKLLRSPYLLDRAAQMNWSVSKNFPADELTFRSRCWNEVVRNNTTAGSGMPLRREKVFLEIALRRARALSPYVQCDDLDPEALELLCKDNLVVMSPETNVLAAPAHDVLEDWAIVEWLRRQFSFRETEAAALANDIEGYPALRRGYRNWLGEMLETETLQADAFVLSTFSNKSLPSYFRDDTLVSILLSSSPSDFLDRQRQPLLNDQGRILVRVIHLLRLACKEPPHWISKGVDVPSQLLVPKGEAWPWVLQIVSEELDQLLPVHLSLLVGLLEDWACSIAWNRPDPPGFRTAGNIAFALLPHLDDYRMDRPRKRVLTVICKIPRANSTRFQDLLARACALDRRDRVASDFAEILLPGFNSSFVCRDLPEQLVRLSIAHFYLTEEDLQQEEGHHFSRDTEPDFGIRNHLHSDFFPASAYRGPFLPLLRYHPLIGLTHIVSLLNHAAKWYGEKRLSQNQLGESWEITLDIPSVGQVVQWANSSLWLLFRGHSVGPYLLQSALMALEFWLLGIGQQADVELEPVLLRLLHDSNNIAVTSVVASICIAYPEKSGQAALALLSSQELIEIDRTRCMEDRFSRFSNNWPSHSAEARICDEERRDSAALPHRQYDLKAMAVKLQSGRLRERVWEILDRHRDNLPPVEQQSEEHRLWRLALHRMDIRGYRVIESPEISEVRENQPQLNVPEQKIVYLGPGMIEADVQEIIDRHIPMRARHEAVVELYLWGTSVWEQRELPSVNIMSWQTRLDEAKVSDNISSEAEMLIRGGLGFVAAVCARDHWDEMQAHDREWCVAELIKEVVGEYDDGDGLGQYSGGSIQPNCAAAYVLPHILGQTLPGDSDPLLIGVLAKALTHPVSNVVENAADGIGYYFQGDWQDFAMRCVGAIAMEARLIVEHQAEEENKSYSERHSVGALIQRVAPEVRSCIEGKEFNAQAELNDLNLDGWPGQRAARTILRILSYYPNSRVAVAFHKYVIEFLVGHWAIDNRDRRLRSNEYSTFVDETSKRVARFMLKLNTTEAINLCDPMLKVVNERPKKIAEFIASLTRAEDSSVDETPYWEIWQLFADQLCVATWVETIDSPHGPGAVLLNKVFLESSWKDSVHHWRRLAGQSHRIDDLVFQLPPTTLVLCAYCRFLFDIGEQSLPNSFIVIADRFGAENLIESLDKDISVYYLESLLRKYIYGEPLRLKKNARMRSATLLILDCLVEVGSSIAFRMRDDFITSVNN